MPGFNPEKINIHDLIIEEPEKEINLPFDAERDLEEYPVSRIQEELQRLSLQGEWDKYSAIILDARFIYPDGEELFKPDSRVFENLIFTEEEYEIKNKVQRHILLLSKAATICLLGGRSRIVDLLEKVEQEVYNDMGEKYDDLENDPSAAEEYLANYKLLYPNYSLPPMEKVIRQLDADIERCKKEKNESNLTRALFIKKIFNGTLSLENEKLVPYGYLRKEMQKSKNVYDFVVAAGQLVCLSAEKISIDENGMHLSLVPKIKSEEQMPSIPEIKNF